MKKLGNILLAIAVIAAFTLTAYAGLRYSQDIEYAGTTVFSGPLVINGGTTETGDSAVTGDETRTGSSTISGTLDVTGAVTQTAAPVFVPTAASWTDGSTNTLSAAVYLVSGTGGANDTTNTIVLANPTTAGMEVTIVMAAATTNLITIADSGNVAASSAILLDANDVVTLYAATTSLWVEKSASDN